MKKLMNATAILMLIFSVAFVTDCYAQKAKTTQKLQKGALKGEFSVAEDNKVHFSQGNLQYQASTKTWRFALHQYDIVGNDNVNISPNYSGWIDVFGWATSGVPYIIDEHNECVVPPYLTTSNWRMYYAYDNPDADLVGSRFFLGRRFIMNTADWGFNAISNGGNTEDSGWRTLTSDEWDYVLNKRNTASGIRWAFAKVNNVIGVILFPDNWNTKTYTINNANGEGYNGEENWLTNVIADSQWNVLEKAGAVFLPNAGERISGYDNSIVNAWEKKFGGGYWTATHDEGKWVKELCISIIRRSVFIQSRPRCEGKAVRLVRNVQ